MTTNNSDSVNNNSDSVNNSSQDIYTLMEGQDGTEFVVSDKGIPYASIRGAARMLGVSEKSIQYALAGRVFAFKGGDLNPVVNAEIVTPGGIQGGGLLDADTVYSLACHYKPQIAFAMGRVGAAVYMLKQAGYKVHAEPAKPATELSRLEILELALESEKKALALAAQSEADSARTALGAAIEVGNEHIRIGEMALESSLV
jgi:hypothetical protein